MSIKKEFPDRIEYWNEKRKLHRLDGPAVEWDYGTKEWYLNGQYHREDGPAIEWSDGDKEWYINGKRYNSEQEHQQEIIKIKLERLKSL